MEAVKKFRIAVLPGDGIGPEVISAAMKVLKAVSHTYREICLEFAEHSVGAGEYLHSGNPLPAEAFAACDSSDAVLLGAMGLPHVRWPDGKEMTPQIDLREKLGLYCGLRPIRLFHPNDSPLKEAAEKGIDLVIVRENCEGLFSARHSVCDASGDEVRDVMKITRRGAERISRAAFQEARRRGFSEVALVDKANVLPSMVFFRSVFDEVAAQFSDIRTAHVHVDAAALFMVKDPSRFQVIVTENMFGDILSDLAAGLVGGMGMAPSADLGDRCAVFQPSHGTAPDIAGKGIANPVATILSAAMMLDWLGHEETCSAATRIESAVSKVLSNPELRCPDLGGRLTTVEMTNLVLEAILEVP